MKSIFDETVYQEILSRIDNLQETTEGQWGKMTVAQMLWHCQFPLRIAIENKKPKGSGNIFAKLFFKKALYNDRPWRKNLPTAPALKAKETKNFASEKHMLKKLVTDCHNVRHRETWNAHPLFGAFTPQQWGQVQFKHLDHHLTQFGV